MTNPRLRSQKLVYPALPTHIMLKKRVGAPKDWDDILGNCDFSALISGRSGSGKDTLTGHIMNRDLEQKRTVIVLDVKMEYPMSIFCQMDTPLRHILLKNGLVGRGYLVNLWIPYVQGLDENKHFLELLEYHHPNLNIRPFRIRKKHLVSEDSANMAMSKSQLQSMADKSAKLSGTTRVLNELREHMAKMKMAFDDDDLWEEGCGWEYVDFDKMAKNGQINVISTFFMMGSNVVAATSFMIGIMNELMTIGKGVHRNRGDNEVFSIVIPELQIILPKRVKALEQVVNTLSYSMLVGMLLMRSFYVRLRINLQNLSSLNPDMLSQSRIFCGKTTNPKDLILLNTQGIKRSDFANVRNLKTGDFIDVINKRKLSCIPYCHKAREKEPLLKCLKIYEKHPSLFLFETKEALFSEIINFRKIFYDNKPLTVPEYERRVKNWLKIQKPRSILPLPDTTTDVLDIDETLNKLTKKKLEI